MSWSILVPRVVRLCGQTGWSNYFESRGDFCGQTPWLNRGQTNPVAVGRKTRGQTRLTTGKNPVVKRGQTWSNVVKRGQTRSNLAKTLKYSYLHSDYTYSRCAPGGAKTLKYSLQS